MSQMLKHDGNTQPKSINITHVEGNAPWQVASSLATIPLREAALEAGLDAGASVLRSPVGPEETLVDSC